MFSGSFPRFRETRRGAPGQGSSAPPLRQTTPQARSAHFAARLGRFPTGALNGVKARDKPQVEAG
jgi:hypothetical protein